MFPAGVRKRLFVVSLRLANQTDAPIELVATLHEAAKTEDFSAATDLAKARASVPPGSETWVPFTFNANPKAPFVWVSLPPTEGLAWRLTEKAPMGSCRAYGGGNAAPWTVVPGQYYAFRTVPPIALQVEGFDPPNVVNGWARRVGSAPNMWASATDQDLPQTLELAWKTPQRINCLYLTFDTDLNAKWATTPLPPECIRDYTVTVHDGTDWKTVVEEKGNFQRRRIHRFETHSVRKLRLTVHATNGAKDARVFEIRAYNE